MHGIHRLVEGILTFLRKRGMECILLPCVISVVTAIL